MKKIAVLFLVLCAALLGAHGHDHDHDEKDHDHHHDNHVDLTQHQIEEAGISIEEAFPGNLSMTLSTRGKIVLHPDRLVHVLPKISGVAKEADKNIGDFVRQGELLAILESREIADIKANYLASLHKEKLASAMYERESRLYMKKVSSEQEYLNAKYVYEEAQINLQLARQKLNALGLNDAEITRLRDLYESDLRLYDIRSPIDGQILNRHITKGEFIEDTTTIYEIADLSNVWVEIGIYPKDLSKVVEGQMIDVSLPGENSGAKARIIYVSPIIDQNTITARAIAQLENSDRKWRPGTFVNIAIETEQFEVPILVSKEAIQNIEGENVVFIRVPEGFEKRSVQTGRTDNKNIEIISGLSPGESYAASKTFLLKADLGKSSAEHEH